MLETICSRACPAPSRPKLFVTHDDNSDRTRVQSQLAAVGQVLDKSIKVCDLALFQRCHFAEDTAIGRQKSRPYTNSRMGVWWSTT